MAQSWLRRRFRLRRPAKQDPGKAPGERTVLRPIAHIDVALLESSVGRNEALDVIDHHREMVARLG